MNTAVGCEQWFGGILVFGKMGIRELTIRISRPNIVLIPRQLISRIANRRQSEICGVLI